MRYRPGVLFGEETREVLDDAKREGYALPAANVISSSSVNAVLETAHRVSSPVIIQFSNGGAAFYGGKGLDNTDQQAAISGAISAAHHIRIMAEKYKVPVILHTDHAARKLLPWIDGLIKASQEYYEKHKRPLYSSHMLDLSEEPLKENVETCVQYFKTLESIGMMLEIELGSTGGEEDGVDNTGIDNARLYTQPKEVAFAYEEMSRVGVDFIIAAAFGNVHGVYRPGNVSLKPIILKNSQEHVQEVYKTGSKPIRFVFHGGSGSSQEEIREAISYGVVKMNVDTDLQWAFCEGVRNYFNNKKDYLQEQIGNPEGSEKPNKKFYDPRVWLREGEKEFIKRLERAFEDLNCLKRN
ncbi:MAG: class II fructose-bisphosphate aldolase [Cytophagales bacterium]|nr:class II fructose-bisphosphate aldolase [Cytophagales bacterium]